MSVAVAIAPSVQSPFCLLSSALDAGSRSPFGLSFTFSLVDFASDAFTLASESPSLWKTHREMSPVNPDCPVLCPVVSVTPVSGQAWDLSEIQAAQVYFRQQ